MGALSLTGQPTKREPFLPLLKGVKHVPYGDIGALRRAVTKKTAMVIIEPIMGEAGVVVPPPEYISAIREICHATGALMVLDCVQTGIGRTGSWFGYEYAGITPDVITLGKGLGGGLPLAAMIACGEAAKKFQPGDHGSTFGGNPITTAAALATIDWIEKKNLMAAVKGHEKILKHELALIPGVKAVRGAGLLIGIELNSPIAKELVVALHSAGVIVNAPTPSVIRIAPALTVTSKQIKTFISIFGKVLSDAH